MSQLESGLNFSFSRNRALGLPTGSNIQASLSAPGVAPVGSAAPSIGTDDLLRLFGVTATLGTTTLFAANRINAERDQRIRQALINQGRSADEQTRLIQATEAALDREAKELSEQVFRFAAVGESVPGEITSRLSSIDREAAERSLFNGEAVHRSDLAIESFRQGLSSGEIPATREALEEFVKDETADLPDEARLLFRERFQSRGSKMVRDFLAEQSEFAAESIIAGVAAGLSSTGDLSDDQISDALAAAGAAAKMRGLTQDEVIGRTFVPAALLLAENSRPGDKLEKSVGKLLSHISDPSQRLRVVKALEAAQSSNTEADRGRVRDAIQRRINESGGDMSLRPAILDAATRGLITDGQAATLLGRLREVRLKTDNEAVLRSIDAETAALVESGRSYAVEDARVDRPDGGSVSASRNQRFDRYIRAKFGAIDAAAQVDTRIDPIEAKLQVLEQVPVVHRPLADLLEQGARSPVSALLLSGKDANEIAFDPRNGDPSTLPPGTQEAVEIGLRMLGGSPSLFDRYAGNDKTRQFYRDTALFLERPGANMASAVMQASVAQIRESELGITISNEDRKLISESVQSAIKVGRIPFFKTELEGGHELVASIHRRAERYLNGLQMSPQRAVEEASADVLRGTVRVGKSIIHLGQDSDLVELGGRPMFEAVIDRYYEDNKDKFVLDRGSLTVKPLTGIANGAFTVYDNAAGAPVPNWRTSGVFTANDLRLVAAKAAEARRLAEMEAAAKEHHLANQFNFNDTHPLKAILQSELVGVAADTVTEGTKEFFRDAIAAPGEVAGVVRRFFRTLEEAGDDNRRSRER